jgi:uncharacterized protein (TIGR04141 family)
MPRGPAQRTLTIYLVSEGITDHVAILRPGAGQHRVNIGGRNAADLYVKVGGLHPPSWVTFFGGAAGDLSGVQGQSAGAVLLIEANRRLFAVTFGFGHLLLQPGVAEERFGLKVTLNAVDHTQIRSVDRETLDSATPHSQIQASRATSITDFGLNIEQDMLRAVTGKPRDTTLGKRLTGKDGLRTTGPFTLDNLPDLLRRLLAESGKNDYKEHFAWVDHIREVKDPNLRHELDDLLRERLQQEEFEGMWLAIPERIDWQTNEGFTYSAAASAERHDDIHLRSFMDSLRNPASITIDAIKHHYRVYAYSNEDDHITHEWPVYQCLYAEVEHNGAQYLLNTGTWYNVDRTFRARIERTFRNLPRRVQVLPNADRGEAEKDYNERVHNGAPQTYALMDRKNIPYPDPQSPIELCDLFSNRKELIHVKKYGQSSMLSHLFAQGVTSATLLAQDAKFRRAASAKLPTTHKLTNPTQPLRPRSHTVTYAIISGSTHALSIPFFSKVTLSHATNVLQGLGFNIQLTKIGVNP